MKKYRSYTAAQRLFAAVIGLLMVFSVIAGTGLPEMLDNFADANAAAADSGEMPPENEYKDETLEHLWDSNGDGKPDDKYLSAARPYYACRNGSFGGVQYRTIFHVFAFEGDTICIGSSVCNSTLNMNHDANSHTGDKGSVDIVMTDLNGNTQAIDIRNSADEGKTEINTTGYIPDWQTEYAAVKFLQKKDGKFSGTYNDGTKDYTYTPYTYAVTETGVYTFEFHSYNKSNDLNNINGNRKRSEPFHDPLTNYGGEIAAINLSVFDENGEEQHGRTYADFLSLQMHPHNNDGVKDAYYILTTDSYIYKMQFNNCAPYTYNFFSNNKGVYDSDPSSGEIIYKSVKDIKNDNDFKRMGVEFKYPGTKDTDLLKSYYIFLEYPDDQLEGQLYEKAVQPDPATNLRFVSEIVDDDGNVVSGAYEGEGGYFAFDVEEATTATLRLEFKGKLSGKKYAPVEISNSVTPHSTNYFRWNGRDGNGEIIPKGEYDISDFAFTLTTKAGEIHFPIIDMENAVGGITFTRLSHIYDKQGNWLDKPGTIYEATKNLIYYDDSAIYYGEQVSSNGKSEADVEVAKGNFTTDDKLGFGEKYYNYKNMQSGGGEYAVRNACNAYVTTNKIRVGDHSHTTNVLEYFDNEGNLKSGDDQAAMIEYLDSATHPAGMTTGGNTTSDYAIANFWTFIPSKPQTTISDLTKIQIAEHPSDNYFDLTGRVFFDASNNGKYDEMSTAGDYPLKDVTLYLYKRSTVTTYDPKKTYVNYDAAKKTITKLDSSNFASATNRFELVSTGLTTGDGVYDFTGLDYDPKNGTEYLYQVVSPGDSYKLTSGGTPAAVLLSSSVRYGYYSTKSYNTNYNGTEIQLIKVGGTNGVDPTKFGYDGTTAKPDDNRTVCAVDVGYNYTLMDKDLSAKKVWENNVSTESKQPNAVVYEIKYDLKNDSNEYIYDYWTLSQITAWQHEDQYLPARQQNKEVDNYYVSAEYYIYDGKIYKHEYSRNAGDYESFIGDSSYVELATIFAPDPVPDNCSVSSLPDLNKDGLVNGKDMGAITDAEWTPINEEDAPYRAVLDRNVAASSTDITITNSAEHGTIEIFKYHDTEDEANALQGATFRVYEGDIATIKALVESSDEVDKATLRSLQRGSATTRSNGRVAFPNLDPSKTYTVREMYAPNGYRKLNEYYQVVPKDYTGTIPDEYQSLTTSFNSEHYANPKIGNALADTNFTIRKQIRGRAWQSDDEFTFTITPSFDDSALEQTGFVIDSTEHDLFNADGSGEYKKTDDQLKEALKAFIEGLTKTTKIISNSNDYYTYTSKREGSTDSYTITSTDEKVSKGLLVPGTKENEGDTSYPEATFCGAKFPMAGTYTFTIKEEKPAAADDSTLTYTDRVYTISIVVKRVKNADYTGTLDFEHSHLEAEVANVTYDDTPSTPGDEITFAGSSPLFTNVYTPAEARQTTSYSISKSFTGREGDEWLGSDKFTVNIVGNDAATQEAIKNGNLVINGLAADKTSDGSGWSHTFTKDTAKTISFTSFTFKDIEFPVKYVDTDGNEWTPTEPDETSPTEGDIASGQYTPKTMPVEYVLKISEDIPAGDPNGIDYDDSVYYLKIVLNNTETGTLSPGTSEEEEEDGVIDEMDFYLYKNDMTTTPQADCKTRQEVVEETAGWDPSDTTDGISWWYVDNLGNLLEYKGSGAPNKDTYKLLIKKTETHDSGSDHEMKITNTYSASCSWAPSLIKTLFGRPWADNDSFTFELTCESCDKCPDMTNISDYVEMPADNTVNVSGGDTLHQGIFGAVKFKKSGTYTFKIAETSHTGGDSVTPAYEQTITVVVTDLNNGKLSTEFKDGYDGTSPLEFINLYTDTASQFQLEIKKTIFGRDWNEGDSFTFTVTPDDGAQEAIDAGRLELPSELTLDGDSYTATISYADGTDPKDVITKLLGNVKVNSLPEDKNSESYTLTVSEDTSDLADKSMRLRGENDFVITIDASRVLDDDNVPTGKLNVTATFEVNGAEQNVTAAEVGAVTVPAATVPFENVTLSKLTVKKQVVSSNDDTTPFDFTVKFTLDSSKTYTEAERIIKADIAGTSSDIVIPAAGSVTKTFRLQHGQTAVFNDIPPYVTYEVEEKTPADGYMLLRIMDKLDGGKNLYMDKDQPKVSGKVDGSNDKPEYLFVNGKIHELPNNGGMGRWHYVLAGSVLMLMGAAALVLMRKKAAKQG